MDSFFNRKLLSVLLFSAIVVVKCGYGQICEQSLPSEYDPTSDPSTATSNHNTFYLYPDFFNATQCTGPTTSADIEYYFCYLFNLNGGHRATVFTVLILGDEGTVYRVLDSYTEREDRDRCPTMSNTCCKTVLRTVTLNVQRELALGFVIPDSSMTDGNALYASNNVMSPGFAVPNTIVQNTAVDSTIDRAGFSGPRSQINNQRFRVSFATGSSPMATTTTTTTTDLSLATTIATDEGNTTLAPGGNNIQESGNNNSGAVAAGVIVCLLVLGAAATVTIVLVVLLLRRRQGQHKFDSSSNGIDNQHYERQVQTSGSINGKSINLLPVRDDTKDSVGGTGDTTHDYAAIPADDAYYEDMNGNPYLNPVTSDLSVKSNASTLWQSQKAQSMRSMGGVSRGDTYEHVHLQTNNDKVTSTQQVDAAWTGTENEANTISIVTKSNKAYATNIVVKNNAAYMKSPEYVTIIDSQEEDFDKLDRNSHQTQVEEDAYVVPASDEHSLYNQFSKIKIQTLNKHNISTTELLDSGQFGTVHKGEWVASEGGEKIEVAVKTLKEGASEEDKVKFLQEAAIMGQFSHPNVVKLYGVVPEGEPIMLILELLPQGDLQHVLRSTDSVDADLPHTLLSYCRQVASGINYLSNKLFIHRDLAARNILVSEDGACKIADFGMSRDLADTNYYVSHGGKIPVKWTAPEAIHYNKYSTASDVWSFGCVMYEIWSLGHAPFEEHTNTECIMIIYDKGMRLAPPPGCPRVVYKLMMDCWHPDPSSRPDFASMLQQLTLPDTKLLKWSEEDKSSDPEAATLGAGLDKAVNLYTDLQKQYINVS